MAEFLEFWEHYPKRVAKSAAFEAFQKQRKKGMPALSVIIAALKAQEPEFAAREAKHIPNPATWLNGARWADEIQPTGSPRKRSGKHAPAFLGEGDETDLTGRTIQA